MSIPLEPYRSIISGFGEALVDNSKGRCYIAVNCRISDFKIKIVVSSFAQFMSSGPIPIYYPKINRLEGMKLADLYFYMPTEIDMVTDSVYLPVTLEPVTYL